MKRGVGLAAVAVFLVASCLAAMPALAAGVSVVQGDHYGARMFPDNFFTVADSAQVTGMRVNFRGAGVDFPACTSANFSVCDTFAMLNKLDGFDLQPRVTVPLTGAVDLASVDDSNFYITDDIGQFVSGMRQLVFDPGSNTMSGISDKFLTEDTPYRAVVTSGIKDSAANPISACSSVCNVRFTTRTASAELANIRKAMDLPLSDPKNAYTLAGFPNAATDTSGRKASFQQASTTTVFQASNVLPSVSGSLPGSAGIVRNDQQRTNPADPNYIVSSVVPNLIPPGGPGYYAFGSLLSPRYQFASATGHQDNPYGIGDGKTDGEIPPVPTKQTPPPQGADRIGLIVVTPDPAKFAPPWPVAIYGPGFTRSNYDIFVTADYNASLGIATMSTDPSGHGYGPNSTTTINQVGGVSTTFKSYGRGRDLDGDGKIHNGLGPAGTPTYDGVGPSSHYQSGGGFLPSHKPIDGLQSGLIQTVVDNMALARSALAGMDIPGVGNNVFGGKPIMYYGLSFGGIYGTMLMGTDPVFHQGLLNVPGGPIADIARLSSFRRNLADTLGTAKPSLLNGGPGNNGFTEDMPLRNDPPVVITHAGARLIQELFGETNWYDRSGSPETFAPRIRLRPDPSWAATPKNVLFQTAYGDGTVPNPTAGTLYRAGNLFDRVVYYRNDKTPTYASDPHGWLADPTLAGRTFGEQQLGLFLATGTAFNTNPAILEVPIANPNNLECLHYPDPQTGQGQTRQPFPASGDCPAAPTHGTPPGPIAGVAEAPWAATVLAAGIMAIPLAARRRTRAARRAASA
ncbi:MAG: Ig-like domain-containing protein [Candidatus Dormibacteraeota bacterium]|nr:Ig-like domain-containing protein [Candidatus Dormibacteraeota bacterium]